MSSNNRTSRLQTAIAGLIESVDQLVRVAQADLGTGPELVSAKTLGIPPFTLNRLVREAALEGQRIGRETFVRRSDWDRYMASQQSKRASAEPTAHPGRRRRTASATANSQKLEAQINAEFGARRPSR